MVLPKGASTIAHIISTTEQTLIHHDRKSQQLSFVGPRFSSDTSCSGAVFSHTTFETPTAPTLQTFSRPCLSSQDLLPLQNSSSLAFVEAELQYTCSSLFQCQICQWPQDVLCVLLIQRCQFLFELVDSTVVTG